jgi:hypothetical protein
MISKCLGGLSGLLMLAVIFCGWLFGSPDAIAQDRVFLDLSVDFLGEYILDKQDFENTLVGGLSGITYDRISDRFYAISDDRSDKAPARFYTLKFNFSKTAPKLEKVTVEAVTFLKNEQGETYARGKIDPEGIALTDRKSVFIVSEGVTNQAIPAFINEFDLKTGAWQQSLPIPKRYLPDPEKQQGIEDNLGFESLTVVNSGSGDPLRVFTATESSLAQDRELVTRTRGAKSRFLHYLVSNIGQPQVVAEHMYVIEPDPAKDANGLSELIAIDRGGHFLSLERTFSLGMFGAKLFQLATGSANDTSRIESLKGDLRIQPIQKKLLLDLNDLGFRLDNLEGMTLGPRLADGSQSLILVSDDNFNNLEVTQFLVFRLNR